MLLLLALLIFFSDVVLALSLCMFEILVIFYVTHLIQSKSEHFNWKSKNYWANIVILCDKYRCEKKNKTNTKYLVLFTKNEIESKMTKQIFFVEYYYYEQCGCCQKSCTDVYF